MKNIPNPTQFTTFRTIKKFDKCGCVQNCRKKQKCQSVGEPREKSISEERQNREIDVCAAIETGEHCTSPQTAHQINVDNRIERNVLKRNWKFCEITLEKRNENIFFLTYYSQISHRFLFKSNQIIPIIQLLPIN